MLSEDALVVLGNGHSLTHLFRHLHHLLRSCLYFSVLKDFVVCTFLASKGALLTNAKIIDFSGIDIIPKFDYNELKASTMQNTST